MDWDRDERLYQPRIHSQRIRALHQISHELGEPITVLVDRALGQFIEDYRQDCHRDWSAAFPEEAMRPANPEVEGLSPVPTRRPSRLLSADVARSVGVCD